MCWGPHSTAERDLGIMIDTKVAVSQMCALADKKANDILGCISRQLLPREKEIVQLLQSS